MNNYPSNFKELRFWLKKEMRKLIPIPLLNLYFSFYPFAGNIFFGRPSQKIKLIAVTGTDGKSSTVIFTTKILQEAGYKVGFFSSIAYGDGDNEYPNTLKMTMPGRFFMQGFLRKLVNNHCDFGVIEVTSEGVKQKRHLFIDFDIAAITNLQPEHIESHGGFENYKSAKAAIFRNIGSGYHKGVPKTIVANNDDPEARKLLQFNAEQKLTFGTDKEANVLAENNKTDLLHNTCRVVTDDQSCNLRLLIGCPFMIENALAAITIAKSLKVPLSICAAALERITSVPGRFEVLSKTPFAIVDYAHTVAAVKKLLPFIRKNWSGKIIHVFGAAGGGRDKWKRTYLAELSEQFTDTSILTEENSFDEPTENILEEIYRGFKNTDRVFVIPKREEAVRRAFSLSSGRALLLLTGKGCETVIAGQLGRKIPYNERETILCLFNNA